jgi:hypothetical protein
MKPNEFIGRNSTNETPEKTTSHRDNFPSAIFLLNLGKRKKLENERAIIPAAINVLAAEIEKPLLPTSQAVQYGMNMPQVKKIAKN